MMWSILVHVSHYSRSLQRISAGVVGLENIDCDARQSVHIENKERILTE